MKEAYRLLHYGALALSRAEQQGIRIDVEYANEQRLQLTGLIDTLTDELVSSSFYRGWQRSCKSKVNLNSVVQLSHYLYKVKKLTPVKLTTTGKGSADEEALEALQIPELNKLLRIRKLKKMRDTYLASFLREEVDGYIHPFFSLNNVVTYRSSSSEPNFQNIPIRDSESKKIIRKGLYPRPGHQLLEIDYGKLEVCIAACYHKDPKMIEYINDPKSDMHNDMTKQIFFFDEYDRTDPSMKLLRGGAKNGFVFPQFYGDYYKNNAASLIKWADLPMKGRWKDTDGLLMKDGENLGARMRRNGIGKLSAFESYLQGIEEHFWNRRFPIYNRWKKRWFRAYQKNGYFDTKTGFRCSGLMGRNDAVNYPIQGSAFHCLLWSFIELDRIGQRDNWDTKLIGQIHDSILFDVNPDELLMVLETVQRVTCIDLLKYWDWIIVPLSIDAEVCEVDQSWYYKKEIQIK